VTFVFCFAPKHLAVSFISDRLVSISVSFLLWHFALLIKLQAARIHTVSLHPNDKYQILLTFLKLKDPAQNLLAKLLAGVFLSFLLLSQKAEKFKYGFCGFGS